MLGVDVIGPAARRTGATSSQRGETAGIGCFWAVELVKNPSPGNRWFRFQRRGGHHAR